MLQKIWNWFVYSSKDPEKLSLTVKSALSFIVPVVLMIAGFSPTLQTVITADSLSELGGAFINLITALATIVSSVSFIYGFGRKIYISYKNR